MAIRNADSAAPKSLPTDAEERVRVETIATVQGKSRSGVDYRATYPIANTVAAGGGEWLLPDVGRCDMIER